MNSHPNGFVWLEWEGICVVCSLLIDVNGMSILQFYGYLLEIVASENVMLYFLCKFDLDKVIFSQ